MKKTRQTMKLKQIQIQIVTISIVTLFIFHSCNVHKETNSNMIANTRWEILNFEGTIDINDQHDLYTFIFEDNTFLVLMTTVKGYTTKRDMYSGAYSIKDKTLTLKTDDGHPLLDRTFDMYLDTIPSTTNNMYDQVRLTLDNENVFIVGVGLAPKK